MTENPRIKISLSLEPAFQIIYWSICWLVFFTLLTVAIETQTISLTLIILAIILGLLVFFGFGSTLKIKNTNLKISYFRGIKTSYISIDEIEKITISPNREVSLVFKQNQKTLRIFLNARNKKKFCAYIERYASNIVFEKQKAWSEMPKLK